MTKFICRFPCCGGNTVNFWPGMFINALCPRLGIIQGRQSVKTSQLLSTVLSNNIQLKCTACDNWTIGTVEPVVGAVSFFYI